MPTTAYNIDRVINRIPNAGRTEVLQTFDELQKIVYAQESEQTYKYDASTGMPPFLATTDGVYEYDCPADCRRTAAIVCQDLPRSVGRSGYGRDYGYDKSYYFNGRTYQSVGVSSRDANRASSTLAKVIFPFNPGTSTDKYYHVYWMFVEELGTEDDELVIPEHVHYLFRQAAIYMLTSESHGQVGLDEETLKKMVKKIRSELNAGAKTLMRQTPIRQEYQDAYEGIR